MKAEAQQQLDEAIPMLEEVMRVLKDIKREDFDNIKTFKAPHPVCVLCMELACHMF